MVSALELIKNIRGKIDEVLGAIIPNGSGCALLDFPNHSNSGDSAIWLGEITWLRENNIEVRYVCDKETYHPATLAQKLGDGIILLHGGGNFGDVWKEHQLFREGVIKDFPNHKIVQMPQTIRFAEEENLRQTRSVLNAHKNFMLLCRDNQSLAFAQKEFNVETKLCPDMAFAIGPLERPAKANTEIVWLARTDKETLNHVVPAGVAGIKLTDWLDESETELHKLNQQLSCEIQVNPQSSASFYPALSDTYDKLAKERVARGCNILSQGKVVVTDRLHGHILSLLMNIPHVLIDNNYGKVSEFFNAWTKESPISLWAGSPETVITELLHSKPFQNLLVETGNASSSFDNLIDGLAKSFSEKAGWITAEQKKEREWEAIVEKLSSDINEHVPVGENIILVDEDQLRNDLSLEDKKVFPFLEEEQIYMGPPPDDETAIKETERLRKEGANFIVFAWPAFWWLEYYKDWNKYLQSNYECCYKDQQLQIFDLRKRDPLVQQ